MNTVKDVFVPNFEKVKNFIQALDMTVQGKFLYELDPARVISLIGFNQTIDKLPFHPAKIGVVSGSLQEPELIFVNSECQIDILDYEQDPELFDLTKDWSGIDYEKYYEQYDLVLCEQVLEHVPNPELAFKNLVNLLAPGGYLHVSVPGINNTHGLPHYFYAGFPPQTLQYFASKTSLETYEITGWVNDKASKMYAICDWTPLGISSGLIQSIKYQPFWKLSLYGKIKICLKSLAHSIKYPGLFFFSKRNVKELSQNYVICWGFFKKPQ